MLFMHLSLSLLALAKKFNLLAFRMVGVPHTSTSFEKDRDADGRAQEYRRAGQLARAPRLDLLTRVSGNHHRIRS